MGKEIITLHEQKIQEFVILHPNWQRTNLRKNLNKIFKNIEDDDEGIPLLKFIPDAYEIDVSMRIVRLLEVDGTSYTNSEKIIHICNFWFEMDCRSWFVELQTIHLFTGSTSIMNDDDLTQKWYSYRIK